MFVVYFVVVAVVVFLSTSILYLLSVSRSHHFGIWIWNFGGLIGYSICMNSIGLCGWRNAFKCDFGVYTYFERLVSICRHSFAFSLSSYSCSISSAFSLSPSLSFYLSFLLCTYWPAHAYNFRLHSCAKRFNRSHTGVNTHANRAAE